jgi:hypothetical protein
MKNSNQTLENSVKNYLTAEVEYRTELKSNRFPELQTEKETIAKRVSELINQFVNESNIADLIIVDQIYQSSMRFTVQIPYKDKDRKGEEYTRCHEQTISFSEVYFDDSKPSELEVGSWFSTSEKPSKTNRLLDYLRLVTYLNEAILNGSQLINRINAYYNLYKATASELTQLKYALEKPEKYLKFATAMFNIFGTIDKEVIMKQVNKTKNCVNVYKEHSELQGRLRFDSKASLLKSIEVEVDNLNEYVQKIRVEQGARKQNSSGNMVFKLN